MRLPMLIPTKSIGWGIGERKCVVWARLLVEAGFLAHLLYMLPMDLRHEMLTVEWNSFPPETETQYSSVTPKVGLCLRGDFFL